MLILNLDIGITLEYGWRHMKIIYKCDKSISQLFSKIWQVYVYEGISFVIINVFRK